MLKTIGNMSITPLALFIILGLVLIGGVGIGLFLGVVTKRKYLKELLEKQLSLEERSKESKKTPSTPS